MSNDQGFDGPTGDSGAPGAGPSLPAFPAPGAGPSLPALPAPVFTAPAFAAPVPAPPPYLAQQPGIVPLRPLSIGEILDGAVKAIRTNPRAMFGLAALVAVASACLGLVVDWVVERVSPNTMSTLEQNYLQPSVLVMALGSLVLTGLIIEVIGDAVLGRRTGLKEAWRRFRPRLPALIGAQAVIMGAVAVLVVLIALVGVAVGGSTSSAGVVLGGLAIVALLAAMIALSVFTALASAPVVLEKHGPIAGIRRSAGLIRGSFWRTVGLLLVLGMILSVLLTVAITLLGVGLGAALAMNVAGSTGPLLAALSVAVSVLANMAVAPFPAAVLCLYYLDRRMRTEALDLTLIRAAQHYSATQDAVPPRPARDDPSSHLPTGP